MFFLILISTFSFLSREKPVAIDELVKGRDKEPIEQLVTRGKKTGKKKQKSIESQGGKDRKISKEKDHGKASEKNKDLVSNIPTTTVDEKPIVAPDKEPVKPKDAEEKHPSIKKELFKKRDDSIIFFGFFVIKFEFTQISFY